MKIALTVDLDKLRAAAISLIDIGAAQARTLLQPDAGLGLIYQRKEAAARAFLASPGAVPALIAAEIGSTAQDALGVSQAIVARADALTASFDKIETARIRAKATVRSATTPADIEAASQVDWANLLSE